MPQTEITKEIERVFAKCTPEEIRMIKESLRSHLGARKGQEENYEGSFGKLVEAVNALPNTEAMKQIGVIFCKWILETAREIKPSR